MVTVRLLTDEPQCSSGPQQVVEDNSSLLADLCNNVLKRWAESKTRLFSGCRPLKNTPLDKCFQLFGQFCPTTLDMLCSVEKPINKQ